MRGASARVHNHPPPSPCEQFTSAAAPVAAAAAAWAALGVVAVGAFVDGVLTGRGVLRLRASAGVGEVRLEA